MKYDRSKLEGRTWSIPAKLYDFIVANVPHGVNLLELGSGYGTHMLSEYFNMYSIEEDSRFINAYESNYIHAPLVDGWYDVDIVRHGLPDIYNGILIDGPVASHGDDMARLGFYNHRNLFDLDGWLFFDDTKREYEGKLFHLIHTLFPERDVVQDVHFSIIYPVVQ